MWLMMMGVGEYSVDGVVWWCTRLMGWYGGGRELVMVVPWLGWWWYWLHWRW